MAMIERFLRNKVIAAVLSIVFGIYLVIVRKNVVDGAIRVAGYVSIAAGVAYLLYYFFGPAKDQVQLGYAAMLGISGLLLIWMASAIRDVFPILAGVLSYFSSKMMQPKQNGENPAGNSMKMMNYMMPFISLFFCISLPAFLGFYWVIQSLVMIIQQYFINRYYDKIPMEELVKANIEKTNKKRAKKGLPPINANATVNTKKLNTPVKSAEEAATDAERRAEGIRQSTDYYNKKAGSSSGSLASKANMVRDYNERHK